MFLNAHFVDKMNIGNTSFINLVPIIYFKLFYSQILPRLIQSLSRYIMQLYFIYVIVSFYPLSSLCG